MLVLLTKHCKWTLNMAFFCGLVFCMLVWVFGGFSFFKFKLP